VGQNGNSTKILNVLDTFFKNQPDVEYDIITINILENPNLMESYNITATPLLIRGCPKPIRKFVGDFTNLNCSILTN